MVVAAKQAVGAEYDYQLQQQPLSRPKQTVKRRIKRRPSPVVAVVLGMGLIAFFFSVGLSYTYLKAVKAQLVYQIQQMKQDNQAILLENEKLNLEIAKLKSLDRVEKIATQEMGMVKNPQIEYLAGLGTTKEAPSGDLAQEKTDAAGSGIVSQDKASMGNLFKRIAAAIHGAAINGAAINGAAITK